MLDCSHDVKSKTIIVIRLLSVIRQSMRCTDSVQPSQPPTTQVDYDGNTATLSIGEQINPFSAKVWRIVCFAGVRNGKITAGDTMELNLSNNAIHLWGPEVLPVTLSHRIGTVTACMMRTRLTCNSRSHRNRSRSPFFNIKCILS